MTNGLTLKDVVEQGGVFWFTCTSPVLASAIVRSGSHGAAHLKDFCLAVEAWWKEPDSPNERRQRLQWIKDVADRFLVALDPAFVAELSRQLSTLSSQLEFVTVLANRQSGRHRISVALSDLLKSLKSAVPLLRPTDADVTVWTARWRTILTLQAATIRHDETIGEVFDAAPAWLLSSGLESLGQVDLYDNIYKQIAKGIVCSSNVALAPAIAALLIQAPPLRLGEQLWTIARFSRPRIPPIDLTDPPVEAAHRILIAVEAELTRANATTVRDRFARFIASCRNQDYDLQCLFRAYLDAVPINHEDVFDFFSRHGTRPRGRVLSDWGGPSVTVSMSGSMRSNSLHYPGPRTDALPSADFNTTPVVAGLSVNSAIQLVLLQPHIEFALAYLNRLSEHPEFARIAESVVADADFTARLGMAEHTLAVAVWDGLDRLASRSESFRQLGEQLQPRLLPRLPSEFLGHGRLRLLTDAIERQAEDLVAGRMATTGEIKELEVLANVAFDFGIEARSRMLAAVDLQRFALPANADSAELDSWIYCVVRMLRTDTALVDGILGLIDGGRLGAIARTHEAFGLRENDETPLIGGRLALKARLLRRWAADEMNEAIAAVNTDTDRDVRMFFWAGFTGGHQLPDGSTRLTPGDQWLDVIAEIAADETLRTYVVSLLNGAYASEQVRFDVSFFVAHVWLERWFARTARVPPEEAWAAVDARRSEAVAKGDLDAASTFACLSLPNAPDQLRKFRERSVQDLRPLVSRVGLNGSRPRETLRRLLAAEAPDLLEELTS